METEFYQDSSADWRWKVTAENNEIVGSSSEGFSSEQAARNNYELLRRNMLPKYTSPHKVPRNLNNVRANKELRQDMDAILQRLKPLPGSRERSLSITKLQEAIMWLGMDLKRLNEENPYPESKNPDSDKIEPTADNMKM
jgi:uncharacterized protein YegP (UPF0339 family)